MSPEIPEKGVGSGMKVVRPWKFVRKHAVARGSGGIPPQEKML